MPRAYSSFPRNRAPSPACGWRKHRSRTVVDGKAEGIWYALGYNFAGVPMGSYLGEKLAQKILGQPEGKTAFDIAPFPTRPFYRGNPWFVPLAMRWFRRQDRRLAKGA